MTHLMPKSSRAQGRARARSRSRNSLHDQDLRLVVGGLCSTKSGRGLPASS